MKISVKTTGDMKARADINAVEANAVEEKWHGESLSNDNYRKEHLCHGVYQ